MRKNLKTITLVKRWEHHTDSGGYSRLRKEIPHSRIIYPKKDKALMPRILNKKIWQYVMPSSRYINGYGYNDMLAELQVFYETSKNPYSIVHSLYAEDQLNLLLRYKRHLKSILVGTFHLPPETGFMNRITADDKVKRFQYLDAAIAVSRNMVSVCEDWVGKGKVTYIPLGVDTSVFTPKHDSENKKDLNPLKIIIVGSHGRDWDVVKNILSECRENDVNIDFYVVIRPHFRKIFAEYPEVKLFSEISEPELIALYRQSDVLLMPVTFATANNSLLESLACGTPVISSNIGGITDYLDNESGWILPKGDARAIYNLLIELVNNRTLIKEREKSARLKAESFEWKKVTKQILDFYKKTEIRCKAEKN